MASVRPINRVAVDFPKDKWEIWRKWDNNEYVWGNGGFLNEVVGSGPYVFSTGACMIDGFGIAWISFSVFGFIILLE